MGDMLEASNTTPAAFGEPLRGESAKINHGPDFYGRNLMPRQNAMAYGKTPDQPTRTPNPGEGPEKLARFLIRTGARAVNRSPRKMRSGIDREKIRFTPKYRFTGGRLVHTTKCEKTTAQLPGSGTAPGQITPTPRTGSPPACFS